MKSFKYLKITILAIIVISTSSFIYYISSPKEKLILDILNRTLQNGHFAPVKIDDAFSEKVFNLYLKRIDMYRRFLIKPDVDQLTVYKTQIDDEILNQTFEFFDLANSLIETRTHDAEKYYKEILSKSFTFDKDETIEFDEEKLPFAKDTIELRDYWRKSLKYQVMTRVIDQLEIQEKAKANNDTVIKSKPLDTLEAQARQKVRKTYADFFHRIEKLNRTDRYSDFLNAITSVYDPHTNYLAPKDKDNFNIEMSGTFQGIGATLTEKDGYVKVESIVPGSASWKQGQLKEGDLILRVAQGDQEPVDIVDMRVDDAVLLIRGKKGTKVVLTVKKINGDILAIPIIRDDVVLEETYAKSAIIKDKSEKNSYGYIYLPKFYANFNEANNGRACSTDVLKEIEKLKKENVQGIILDLRNNGGGSLQDAVNMGGYFIKKGPIVQVKSRGGNPYILDDKDEQQQYTGKLIILVNYFSASASEILAAAMQDYNRAIIMGSTTTYGKGSVQRIFDFDDMVRGPNENKPLGSIKMTIQKFYRINGGTTQLKGVIPDIILPEPYQKLDLGEKENDYPMPYDQIKPAVYEKSDIIKDINKLRTASEKRISKINRFALINEKAEYLKKRKDKTSASLNMAKYREELKADKLESKKFEDAEKEETDLSFVAPKDDLTAVAGDSTKIAKITKWHKELKHDIYLKEAINVMSDWKLN